MRQILFASSFIIGAASYAQDPEFSQFYANRLYLNPAFAGTEGCPRVGLNYRNQWPSLDHGFVTYTASYDQHFDALAGGLGLLVLNDQAGAGTVTSQSVSAMYAYLLNITWFFSMTAGAQVSYFEKKVDFSKLTFGDMIDPRQGFIYTTDEVPLNDPARGVDFSAGVLGFSEKYFGGFAFHHLTEPNESLTQSGESKLPRKFTLHGGAMIPIKGFGGATRGTVSPNFIYQNQNGFNLFNYGFYASRGIVTGGLWVRHSMTNIDAVIGIVGLKTDRFRFGYSYDVTVSRFTNSSGGSHELSLIYHFNCRVKTTSYNTAVCPTF